MLAARRRGAQTVLADLALAGSAKLLFPRPRGPALEAVSLNTAGGVTGGDMFDLSLRLQDGAAVTLTTQAAERIYRAVPGAPGRVCNRLTAAAGTRVNWLPQETILYDGAALDRSLVFDIAPDTRLLACETLVFGRRAMGETIRDLRLRDHVSLYRGGALAYADRLHLSGDAQAQLDRPGVSRGMQAMASLLLAAPDAAAHVPHLRACLPHSGGASALADDLLFLRLLAPDSHLLRQSLIPILTHLLQDPFPRTWMI